MKRFLFHAIEVLLPLMALVMTSATLSAQSRNITGRVTDESGAPLSGVFVRVPDVTTGGAMTDNDGRYSISVGPKATSLLFNMLGMKDVTVQINGRSVINVSMETDATVLQEAVAVGYGTIIRRELSTSVASVKSDALNERATAINLQQSMAGKLAGVAVTSASGRPGGTMQIRVRGMGSISASSDPLYVVDGVVDVDPSLINSADVESIDVLKDAAATSIYGAKGANGVVMITTKSGNTQGAVITFDSHTGVSFVRRLLDTTNAEEYMEYVRQAYANDGQVMPQLLTPNEKLFNYQKDASGNYAYDSDGLLIATPKYDTDWQKEAFRTALVTTNSLSFSQGSEKTKVYGSIGFQDVQGVLKTTYQKRMTGNLNVTTELKKWVTARMGVSASHDKDNSNDNEGTMMNGAIRTVYSFAPIIPVEYPDGTPGRANDYYTNGEAIDNTITQLNGIKHITERTNVLVNGGFDFHLAPGLTLTTNASYNNRFTRVNHFAKKGIFNWSTTENVAYVHHYDVTRWSNEDYLNYDKTFFDDRLKSNFVLGASWYYYHSEDANAESHDISNELFEWHRLQAGTNPVTPSSAYDKQTMNSFYFRTNQVWREKYMLGLTLRYDGASVLGKDNKYGFFPSASAAWTVSEEPFFEPLKDKIDALKLRVSYGRVGNANIGSYNSIAQFSSGTRIFNNQLNSYSTLANLGNADLGWETSSQFDVGLDLSAFNNRIQLITDFYIKRSYDLLYAIQLPYTTGYDSVTTNAAELKNTGFELTLNTHNIDHKDFKWDTDFIFSTNYTKCVDLKRDGQPITGAFTVSEEGHEWAKRYYLHQIGTWGTDEVAEAAVYNAKPGDYKYEDVNKDGVINEEDYITGGHSTPKYELSMVNTLQWKGFTFMLDLGSMLDFEVASYTQWLQEVNLNSSRMKNAWTPNHQDTMVASPRNSNHDANQQNSDYYCYDGSFLRVRNVALSYDFKRDLLKHVNFFKGFSFGVNIENAYIFTGYKAGFDPECGWGSGIGTDWLTYPRPTTITGNLKITF